MFDNVSPERRAQINAEIELAKSFWPKEVASILSMSGKKRNTRLRNIRAQAVKKRDDEALMSMGLTCSNCAKLNSTIIRGKTVCGMGSSHEGYEVVLVPSLAVCKYHQGAE